MFWEGERHAVPVTSKRSQKGAGGVRVPPALSGKPARRCQTQGEEAMWRWQPRHVSCQGVLLLCLTTVLAPKHRWPSLLIFH